MSLATLSHLKMRIEVPLTANKFLRTLGPRNSFRLVLRIMNEIYDELFRGQRLEISHAPQKVAKGNYELNFFVLDFLMSNFYFKGHSMEELQFAGRVGFRKPPLIRLLQERIAKILQITPQEIRLRNCIYR